MQSKTDMLNKHTKQVRFNINTSRHKLMLLRVLPMQNQMNKGPSIDIILPKENKSAHSSDGFVEIIPFLTSHKWFANTETHQS